MAPTKVVEVRHDRFSDQRFRHGCTFIRVREDELPKDRLLEHVLQRTLIKNIKTFIEACGDCRLGCRPRNLKPCSGSNFYEH